MVAEADVTCNSSPPVNAPLGMPSQSCSGIICANTVKRGFSIVISIRALREWHTDVVAGFAFGHQSYLIFGVFSFIPNKNGYTYSCSGS